MASAKQIQEFYSQWFPTVLSFVRLYTGNDTLAAHLAAEVFCGYLHTGLPYETNEMPLVLWECAVDVAEREADPAVTISRRTEFENAVFRLHSEERLVFLLHALFALPAGWISLITGWPLAKVHRLADVSSAQMRNLLGFSTSTPSALVTQDAAGRQEESC
jgi:hypothetical protein